MPQWPVPCSQVGLGWAERLSQEGRARSGESPSVHIRLPPPCLLSVLALAGPRWPPPPCLTPLRPTRVDGDSLSPALSACTVLFSHCPCCHPRPRPHAITLSFCLWLSPFPLSSLLSSPSSFLGFCSSLPPCHSLHLRPELPSLSCLVAPFPLPFCRGLPPTAAPLPLIFSYPSPRCPWPVPLAPSRPLSPLLWLPDTGKPRGARPSQVHW